jgi:hypothetical protein
MTRITSLTGAQEQRLCEYRRAWLARGLRTDPADRNRAECAITELYRVAGYPRPSFAWCGSIYAATLETQRLRRSESVFTPLLEPLRASLRSSLALTVGERFRAALWASMWASLAVTLCSSLRDRLCAGLHAAAPVTAPPAFGGPHDACWIAFYQYAERELGAQFGGMCRQRLDWWSAIAESTGWWWPYKSAVVLAERPDRLEMEAISELGESDNLRLRLHCATGPAIRFRDGWSLWAWHGTLVPPEVVEMPESLTLERVRCASDPTIRDVLIERYGRERYQEEWNAHERSRDRDSLGRPRILWVTEAPGEEPVVVLETVNSTPEPDGSNRHFLERVPPWCASPSAALAWQWNIPEGRYIEPAVET